MAAPQARYARALTLSKEFSVRIEGVIRAGGHIASRCRLPFLCCHTQEGPVLDDQCSALCLEMTWEKKFANRTADDAQLGRPRREQLCSGFDRPVSNTIPTLPRGSLK